MKILVTGGAGFIGFHTAKALAERGDKVVVVDNFNDYYDVNLKKARAKILKKIAMPGTSSTKVLLNVFTKAITLQDLGVEVIKADFSDYKVMEKIFKKKFDKVCHLGAQAGVRYSLTHPFIYERSNILGTLNLLELCRHNNVKDFIFASSSSIYGNNKKLPFSEQHKVDTPISLYAATKKSNEEMAHTYHHLYGLNCTGLRFFTVYGPFGRPDMALGIFTKAMLEGNPIKVFNSGNMKRDFTYISDIVSGVISAIDKPYPFQIFNLARGKQVNLLEFIKEIEKNLGVKAKKEMLPIQLGDVPETSADISKAKKMLGYSPKVSVKEGIKNFIDWYKEYYKK